MHLVFSVSLHVRPYQSLGEFLWCFGSHLMLACLDVQLIRLPARAFYWQSVCAPVVLLLSPTVIQPLSSIMLCLHGISVWAPSGSIALMLFGTLCGVAAVSTSLTSVALGR